MSASSYADSEDDDEHEHAQELARRLISSCNQETQRDSAASAEEEEEKMSPLALEKMSSQGSRGERLAEGGAFEEEEESDAEQLSPARGNRPPPESDNASREYEVLEAPRTAAKQRILEHIRSNSKGAAPSPKGSSDDVTQGQGIFGFRCFRRCAK